MGEHSPWGFSPWAGTTAGALEASGFTDQQTHGRRPVGRPELADGFLDVAIDRLGRDVQTPADVLGRPMACGELKTLALPGRETIQTRDSRRVHKRRLCHVPLAAPSLRHNIATQNSPHGSMLMINDKEFA
jgi:hypothetical protein